MLLHPQFDSQNRAILPGVREGGLWKVGQRLHIGEIITHKGDSVESLMLEPQGIAHLISEECVDLPDNICGMAHVLTGMCNEGLLTLNIGIVDPGWKNRLSTPVLNFSSEKRLLQKGDVFIRITYHRINLAEDVAPPTPEKRDKNLDEGGYVRAVRARSVGSFGKNFLNIKRLVGQASKKENARFKETMLKYLPIGAFSLAFFALMVTIGIATIARLSSDETQANAIQRLEEKVQELERNKRTVSSAETELPQARPGKVSSNGGRQ
jgi:hypothetical protein